MYYTRKFLKSTGRICNKQTEKAQNIEEKERNNTSYHTQKTKVKHMMRNAILVNEKKVTNEIQNG